MKSAMETKEYIPFEATHPGSLIKDELKYRRIAQKEFAIDIDMQPTMLNELINEKRAITAEIALALEKGLGITAEYWMRHQAGYELDCARIKERNIQKSKHIEIWGLLKQYVPVSIFSKLGLFTNSLADNIAKVWEVYEVKSIDGLIESFSIHKNLALYKKSTKLNNDLINNFAWSKYAQWIAKPEKLVPFEPESKVSIVLQLKSLFYDNKQVVEETKRILNSKGIKFFVIDKFKQSPTDGYSFWSIDNPAIVVTQRKTQLDNFAFTVLHELGHVFEHLKPNGEESFLDIDCPDIELNEKEEAAHKFAERSFVEDKIWDEFMKQNPHFNFGSTEHQIIQLAGHLRVHPSIILGRYCYETGQFAIKTAIDRTIH